MPAVQYSDTVNIVDQTTGHSFCYLIFNKKINIFKLLFFFFFTLQGCLNIVCFCNRYACSLLKNVSMLEYLHNESLQYTVMFYSKMINHTHWVSKLVCSSLLRRMLLDIITIPVYVIGYFNILKPMLRIFLVFVILNSKFCLLVPLLFYGEIGAVFICSFEYWGFLGCYEMSTCKLLLMCWSIIVVPLSWEGEVLFLDSWPWRWRQYSSLKHQ